MKTREDIRNVAIIAHVDHGKTTLVNELLKQSDTLDSHTELDDRVMDSDDLERERGITILSKITSVDYKDNKINIVDTPGHADFGGEVERIMKMVDGVVLVVDAYEGTMPQTRFVLQKALERNLKPLVVVNKIDKPNARPEEVVDMVLDLFIELGADEDQIEFPVVYASAVNGTSSLSDDPADQKETMNPVFDTILSTVPAPVDNSKEPLQFQISMLDYNDYVGRIGIGRVFRGTVSVGDQVTVSKADGGEQNFRVTKLLGYHGLKRVEIQSAKPGDIIAVSGMEDIYVGDTVTSPDHVEPMEPLRIDEPTLKMTFLVNDSPFAGREGKYVTSRQIADRLHQQLQTDVSMKIEDTGSPDRWIIAGRGELHLSILIENMRREGYELQVSKPEVITKEIDGKIYEPYEEVIIDTPEEYMGSIIESLSSRKGEMKSMDNTGTGQIRLTFSVPSRGMIGFSTQFMSMTHGYGILNHTFSEYGPAIATEIGSRSNGVLVSMSNGKATTYSIMQIEERGQILIEPGTEIYEGMIVGISSRDKDLAVNLTKEKQKTNVRSANKDQTNVIKTPKILTLEESLEFIADDEYVEVTPESIRLRKKTLDTKLREKEQKKSKKDN